MMIAPSALRRVLLVLPMLVLAACNTVGEGNKIETLQLKDVIGRALPASLQTYQCLRYNLSALGTFSDGSSAFYTDRATWSSDNTSVLRVSNGDIQLASDPTLAYSKGTLIPVSPGTANVTVDYVGIKSSVQVTVLAPTSNTVQIVGVTPRDSRPTGTITIAPRTVQTFAAIANLGGRTTDITSAGTWSLDTTGTTQTANDLIAQFVTGSKSSFKGVGVGGPLNVLVNFNSISGVTSCPLTPTTPPKLSVAALQSIALSSEFNPVTSLFVGTTDRLIATATLTGNVTQDISELGITGDGATDATVYNIPLLNSSTATPDTATVSDYSAVLQYNNLLRSLISAISTDATPGTPSDANTAQLTAKFITVPAVGTGSDTHITSNTLKRTTQNGTLAGIQICAVAAANAATPINSCPNPAVSTVFSVPQSVQYGEDQARLQLRAVATFNPTGGGSAVTQDVTRHVTWTSSNTGVITVTNASISPTQAGVAASIVAGTVTVNAAWSKDGVNTVTSNTLSLTAQ